MEKILTQKQIKRRRHRKRKCHKKLKKLYPIVKFLRLELKRYEDKWNHHLEIFEKADREIAYSNHFKEMKEGKHKPMKMKEVLVDPNKLSDKKVSDLIDKLQERFNRNQTL